MPSRQKTPSLTVSRWEKTQHAAPRFLAKARGYAVVGVDDQHVPGALMEVNIALGVDVILVSRVLIQVVRRYVGNHGYVRPFVYAVKLEAGELEHRYVVGAHIRYLAQQGLANIAAQVYAPPWRPLAARR